MLNIVILCFRCVITARNIIVVVSPVAPTTPSILCMLLQLPSLYLEDPLDYLLLQNLLSLIWRQQVVLLQLVGLTTCV